jgi:hypothetical protein
MIVGIRRTVAAEAVTGKIERHNVKIAQQGRED